MTNKYIKLDSEGYMFSKYILICRGTGNTCILRCMMKKQNSSVNLGVKKYKTHTVFQGLDQIYKTVMQVPTQHTPTFIWV